jgi:hypothetical protein
MNFITSFFKQLAVKYLAPEIASLKARLASASASLDKIEQEATHVAADASVEVKALAASTLSYVLNASDKVRSAATTGVNDFEKDLYNAYEGSAVQKYAEELIADTKLFFAKL